MADDPNVGGSFGGGRALERKATSSAARCLPAVISVPLGPTTAFIVGDLLFALVPGGRPRLPFRIQDSAAVHRSLLTLLAFGPEWVGGP